MSGRSAPSPARTPRTRAVRPTATARRATGARGPLRDLVRTVGGLGRLLLLGVGFGLALVLCATAVLNSRQSDAGGDSRLIVPGAWAAEENPPSEADRRAAERDAELDRVRREADQASVEAALNEPAKATGGPRHADDDHGPAVGTAPESREPRRSPDEAATRPAEPGATEEPPAPKPSERRESTRPPRTAPPASEPTREPSAPRGSREPSTSPEPVPTRPSASPTEPDPSPSASTRPSTRPSSSTPPEDEDDDECTIKLLGICL